MLQSGVQNAQTGFPARPPAGWPPKTRLHAEVRRFGLSAEAAAQAGTQACGVDNSLFWSIFDLALSG